MIATVQIEQFSMTSSRPFGMFVGPITRNRAGNKGEKKSWERKD